MNRHAECVRCGALLHACWMQASSPRMLEEGWSFRLLMGCADCGGELLPVVLFHCPDCRAMEAA